MHQVHCPSHQLLAVAGVDVGGPVRVGAGEHQRAERGREVQYRAHVDGGALQPGGLQAFGLVALK